MLSFPVLQTKVEGSGLKVVMKKLGVEGLVVLAYQGLW